MKKAWTREEIREATEHRDILMDINSVLGTSSGQRFFKYLFKHFRVSESPELGLTGEILHEELGFLRAGVSIFQLASEASVQIAGQLLSQKEKERYDELMEPFISPTHEDGTSE